MNEYLINEGIRDCVLTLYSGEQIAGEDLKVLVNDAKECNNIIDRISDKYDKNIVEQTAIAGALNLNVLNDLRESSRSSKICCKPLGSIISRS